MAALKALLLGGVAWNTMVYVDEFPLPQPHTAFARGMHEAVGSSGAGKALNFSYLGVDTTLWGLIGDDAAGRRVRDSLSARGVRFIPAIDPAGTMRHVNLMNAAGDRISIFANAGSQEYRIDTDTVAAAAAAADIVSVTIMNYCRQFLPWLRKLGKDIWVDIHDYDGSNPYHTEFIEAADYLFMSSQAMPGWRRFLEGRVAAGTRAAVCTHGAAGASGLTAADGWVDVAADEVKMVVDTNGAGDAFFAGFATEWKRGSGLAAALDRGAALAAAAIQSLELAPSQ